MKPYASYKPSGVPWLGDVPGQWEVSYLRHVLVMHYGDALAADVRVDGDVPVYGSNGIVGTHNASNTDAPAIIVGRKGSYGKLNFSESAAFCIDTAYHIGASDCDGCSLRFIYYALMPLGLDTTSQDTGVPGLSREVAYRTKISVPPPDEQQAIADYLDVETARIDTLIHEKDELIGLLREARSSTIIEAVSRGVYPSAPLKSSGLHFLGNVPRHWEKFKVAHAFGTSSGTTPPTDEPEWYEGDVPWVQSSELRENVVFSTEKKVTVEAVQKFSALKLYPVGTLLLAMYGATIGRVGLLGVPATTNQACCALRPLGEISTQFFCWWLQAYRDELVARGYGGGQPNISATLISGMYFFAPPPDEQHAIVAYLDAETAKIDDLIAHTHDEITLLKELRAATIADAVLGRIDVRTIPLACRDTP